jgi:hypothetical protein
MYNYSNSSVAPENLTCYDATNNSASSLLPITISCSFPLVNAGSRCLLPCPFPVFTADEEAQVQAAFIVPAFIGLALCLFVLFDGLWQVFVASHGRFRRVLHEFFEWSASGSTGTKRAGSQTIKSAVIHQIIGAVLGIIYVLLGPLATLQYGSNVSCASSSINIDDVLSGTYAETSVCRAQRASPFILQMIFNLILYSMVKVWFALGRSSAASAMLQKVGQRVILPYCVLTPILCLAIALGLEQLSTDLVVASTQLSRQGAICQVRLPLAAEVVLVFVPFIISGVIVVAVSVRVLITLFSVQKQVANIVSANNNDNSKRLADLIRRLAVLGLLTLIILVVLMTTTGVYQNSLQIYAPLFYRYFSCSNLGKNCLNCYKLYDMAQLVRPSPAVLGLQLASMSCITLLFGIFFGFQSLARLFFEFRSGALQKLCKGAFAQSSATGGSFAGSFSDKPGSGPMSNAMATRTVVSDD